MSNKTKTQVRDLLYFDFDKAASIWSQYEGGLLERTSVTEDGTETMKAGLKAGIPKIIEASLGAEYGDKQSRLETRILHHDLLNKLETRLKNSNLVLNLNEVIEEREDSAEKIRKAIGTTPYLISNGSSVFEDYRHILFISQNYNDLIKFINTSARKNLEKTTEFAELQKNIEQQHKEISRMTGKQKVIGKSKLKKIEGDIEELMKQKQIEPVEQWIIDGIKGWIETFFPNRLTLRIYPFSTCPSFQLISNLKKDCFVDQDLEHLLYAYGSKPNVSLSVFGLVTSLPPKSGETFNPLLEFDEMNEASEAISWEKAFRGMFHGLEGLEEFVRFSRYPNVTLHPIAVFRQF